MSSAAEKGHLDVVQFMIDKGANDWNQAMLSAAENGYTEIVQLMIEKGADDWDSLFTPTIDKDDRFEYILYMCQHRPTESWNLQAMDLLLRNKSKVIEAYQMGQISKQLFCEQHPVFESWIEEFERYQQLVHETLYQIPHVLCDIIVNY